MTTKTELIAQCKTENPTMVVIVNDENIQLTNVDYDKACNDWAEMRLAQITLENEITSANTAKESAQAKLAALGLTADDLKALGL
jgi:hypothetical protein